MESSFSPTDYNQTRLTALSAIYHRGADKQGYLYRLECTYL